MRACGTCQYFRRMAYCSNSESVNYRQVVSKAIVCPEYAERGARAPVALRVAVKTARLIKRKINP